MRILFDQGTPVPLKDHLTTHVVSTAYELGWSDLENDELLTAAEASFELLITTDQQIRYQQSLAGRQLAILVLSTTSWPRIRNCISDIQDAIAAIRPGQYHELTVK